jgi:hypothetical protein
LWREESPMGRKINIHFMDMKKQMSGCCGDLNWTEPNRRVLKKKDPPQPQNRMVVVILQLEPIKNRNWWLFTNSNTRPTLWMSTSKTIAVCRRRKSHDARARGHTQAVALAIDAGINLPGFCFFLASLKKEKMSWRVSRPALHKVYSLFFASYTAYECDAMHGQKTPGYWWILRWCVERPERCFKVVSNSTGCVADLLS